MPRLYYLIKAGDNLNKIEKVYSELLRYGFAVLNPLKKKVIKTQCEVHIFINNQALVILKNDHYIRAYDFYSKYIDIINEGSVWADQDFKSSMHMYNPYTKRGLWGRKNAMELSVEYLNNASILWIKGENDKSLFFFGAALHIIQDMTIPQHANVRLLDSHRQYENFVKSTYKYVEKFKANKNLYLLDDMYKYVRFNSRIALKIYKKFKNIEDDRERFYKITSCNLPLAEKTTAGCMVNFFEDVVKKRWS